MAILPTMLVLTMAEVDRARDIEGNLRSKVEGSVERAVQSLSCKDSRRSGGRQVIANYRGSFLLFWGELNFEACARSIGWMVEIGTQPGFDLLD
jgi:hypothetical protein